MGYEPAYALGLDMALLNLQNREELLGSKHFQPILEVSESFKWEVATC